MAGRARPRPAAIGGGGGGGGGGDRPPAGLAGSKPPPAWLDLVGHRSWKSQSQIIEME